jgi:hypothetical protein
VQCFGKKKTGKLSFFPTGDQRELNLCADIFKPCSGRQRWLLKIKYVSAQVQFTLISGRKKRELTHDNHHGFRPECAMLRQEEDG